MPVPDACPDCGGELDVTRVASQYQEELPAVRPTVRRFDIEIGRCAHCGRRVQGRHRLQTSDALGAAGVQLDPGVAALVVQMHIEVGVSLAKLAKLLRTTFGLQVNPGGLVHLLHRVACDAAPRYGLLREQVGNSNVSVNLSAKPGQPHARAASRRTPGSCGSRITTMATSPGRNTSGTSSCSRTTVPMPSTCS